MTIKSKAKPVIKITIPKGTTIYSGYPGQEEIIAEEDQVIKINEDRIGHDTTEISWAGAEGYKKWINTVDILVANPELHQLMIKNELL